MIKIGITGSLASGKSTVVKLMSKRKYPIFNADKEVAILYKKKVFINKIKKKFKLKKVNNLKSEIKSLIKKDSSVLKKLEKIIHPLVRREMRKFMKKRKNYKIGLFEVPLLIESKLMKHFDVIVFVNAKKNKRRSRFKGKKEIFTTLDKRQINAGKKIKFCDHVINNNNSMNKLKNKVKILINSYE